MAQLPEVAQQLECSPPSLLTEVTLTTEPAD